MATLAVGVKRKIEKFRNARIYGFWHGFSCGEF